MLNFKFVQGIPHVDAEETTVSDDQSAVNVAKDLLNSKDTDGQNTVHTKDVNANVNPGTDVPVENRETNINCSICSLCGTTFSLID